MQRSADAACLATPPPAGEGEGYNHNFPLPQFTDGPHFLATLTGQALPLLQQYAPDALVISLGVDTAAEDPEGSFTLQLDDFKAMGSAIAAATAAVPVRVVIQEGGYKLDRIGNDVVAFLEGFYPASA